MIKPLDGRDTQKAELSIDPFDRQIFGRHSID
jgi:hypothetical protein